jgi:hypothetical protein
VVISYVHLQTSEHRDLDSLPVAFQVRKSGKSKNDPALSHWLGRCFLSHSNLGVSISREIFPPTYLRTEWLSRLIWAVSSDARWSSQRITFCWSLPDGLTLKGFPDLSRATNEQVASKPNPFTSSGSIPFVTFYNRHSCTGVNNRRRYLNASHAGAPDVVGGLFVEILLGVPGLDGFDRGLDNSSILSHQCSSCATCTDVHADKIHWHGCKFSHNEPCQGLFNCEETSSEWGTIAEGSMVIASRN